MKRTRPLLVGLFSLALLVTACGDGDGGATTTAAPDDGATTTAAPDDGATTTAAPDDGATTTEVAGEPIVVGAIFDLSGPTSDVGVPFAEGAQAYIAWLNANGGVEGRPIELLSQDYEYDVANAEQLFSQFVSEGAVAFFGWGTADTEALRTRVTEDEIPFQSASYAETLVDPAETPYNFVPAATYSQQLRIALRHIADEAGGENVEVALFHHDSPFGLSPLEDGHQYIADAGLDIGLQNYPMPAGAVDYFGELSQASAQGAGYIIVQNVSSPAAQLAGDIQSQGIEATLFCLNWCADELLVELAGDATDGALGVLPFAPPSQATGDLSSVEAYLSDAGQSLDEVNLHFTQGWYQFSVVVAAMEYALAEGMDLTGPNIKAALEEMPPLETPVTSAIHFTAESHAGMETVRVYEVQDGNWVAITDAITP
jgi:branched-chain amino acid transport system substrate-binding protein